MKPRSGPLAPSCVPTRQIAGPRSRTSSTPTRWRSACGRSWPRAAPGPEALQTFCALGLVLPMTAFREETPGGPKIPARSPAACAALRPSCGQWASTLPSVVKAAPEAGSSGCVRHSKTPSAPSAASATLGRDPLQDNLRRGPATSPSRVRPVTTPSRPQTTLTLLTQTPTFVSGNRCEGLWLCGRPTSCHIVRVDTDLIRNKKKECYGD